MKTFNPQQHYDNSKGSLYKMAEELKLNHWEFDIFKRLVRCRKKGQFEEDLQKIKDTIDIYLSEYPNTEKEQIREAFNKSMDERIGRLITNMEEIDHDTLTASINDAREVKEEITSPTNVSPFQQQCLNLLGELEEPYKTQALENFDEGCFKYKEFMFIRTKTKYMAILVAFDWKETENKGQGYDYWYKYYNKLKDRGE